VTELLAVFVSLVPVDDAIEGAARQPFIFLKCVYILNVAGLIF